MKILMLNRPTAFLASGGDVMQMESTRCQQKLGHEVEVSLSAQPDVSRFDIVHVFNMQSGTMPHSFRQISHAKKCGKPVVLSTIYWTHTELNSAAQAEIAGQAGARRRSATLLKTPPRAWPMVARHAFEKFSNRGQSFEQQKACLEMADALLPNTRAEKELLMRDFGADETKVSGQVSCCAQRRRQQVLSRRCCAVYRRVRDARFRAMRGAHGTAQKPTAAFESAARVGVARSFDRQNGKIFAICASVPQGRRAGSTPARSFATRAARAGVCCRQSSRADELV